MSTSPNLDSASLQIDSIIDSYGGWKTSLLTELRQVINQAHSSIVEEVKWKTASRPAGLPVWSSQGIVCIAETWKDNIKLIFFKGTELSDTYQVFNARLQSKTDRAIELRQGDVVPVAAITELVIQAVELNKGG